MPTIHVQKAFNLLFSPHEAPTRYEVGVHEVGKDVADHPYTKLHSGHPAAEAEAGPTKAPAKRRGKKTAVEAEAGEDADGEQSETQDDSDDGAA